MSSTYSFHRGISKISDIMSQAEQLPLEDPPDFAVMFSNVREELRGVPALANLSLAPLECRRAFRKGEDERALRDFEELCAFCKESPFLHPIKQELVRVCEYMTRTLEARFVEQFEAYVGMRTEIEEPNHQNLPSDPSSGPLSPDTAPVSSEREESLPGGSEDGKLRSQLSLLRRTVSQLSRLSPQLSVFSSLLSKIQEAGGEAGEEAQEQLDHRISFLFDCFRDQQGNLPPRLQLVFSLSPQQCTTQ